MKYIAICILLFVAGCINTIEVQTTKSWEGHYMNTNQFFESTKNIKLDKNESIWVLSNKTLSRVLKNIGK